MIRITELCQHDGGEGMRIVYYRTKSDTLLEALREYEEDFNSDNIISSNDDFEKECNSSEVISVEFVDYK